MAALAAGPAAPALSNCAGGWAAAGALATAPWAAVAAVAGAGVVGG